MPYRPSELAIVFVGLIASLSACGDDVDDLGNADASAAVDAAVDGAIDANTAFEGAVDAASGDSGHVAVDDASMDADVLDARAESDASDDGGDISGDANDAPDPDASADAATDSSVPIDPNALSVAIDYQVRCLDCNPIAPDSPQRRIHSGESAPDVALECEVLQLGDERFATFSISYVDPMHSERSFSLSVRTASLDGADDPGPLCEVRVREGMQEYRGRCTGTASTSSDPCRLQLSLDGTDLSGSLHCSNIQHLMSASIYRHVVAAGTSDEPAMFEFHNCSVPAPSQDAGFEP